MSHFKRSDSNEDGIDPQANVALERRSSGRAKEAYFGVRVKVKLYEPPKSRGP